MQRSGADTESFGVGNANCDPKSSRNVHVGPARRTQPHSSSMRSILWWACSPRVICPRPSALSQPNFRVGQDLSWRSCPSARTGPGLRRHTTPTLILGCDKALERGGAISFGPPVYWGRNVAASSGEASRFILPNFRACPSHRAMCHRSSMCAGSTKDEGTVWH